jgi:hypothetical protein
MALDSRAMVISCGTILPSRMYSAISEPY